MEFKCNFDEMDYTRAISQALKLENIRIILGIEEIADIEKVLILKELLGVEAKRADGTEVEEYEYVCDEVFDKKRTGSNRF